MSYVADSSNQTLRRIGVDGSVTTLAGLATVGPGYADGIGAAARFYLAYGIALDDGGNAYVADAVNNRIRRVAPDGRVTTLAGGTAGSQDGTGSQAQFRNPTGIARSPDGTLYVTEMFNPHRAQDRAGPAG